MALPDYVTTRDVSIGGAYILESGEQVKVRLVLVASKSLIWEATGFRFEKDGVQAASAEPGAGVLVQLPVTDQPGWRDAKTGERILVDAAGSYTHRYIGTLTVLNAQGLALRDIIVGPFVLPTGDGSPVDLDLVLPVGTKAGDTVFVPDSWSQFAPQAAASAQAAAASAAQAGTSAFNAGSSAAAAQASENDAESAAQAASNDAAQAVTAKDVAVASADVAVAGADLATAKAGESVTSAASALASQGSASASATAASGYAQAADTDAAQTAADRVQTGLDKTAAAGSATASQTARVGSEQARTAAEEARDLSLAGQFLGTAVTTVVDVDTYRTPGRWRFQAGATASNGLPVATAGVLDVFNISGANNATQEFTPFAGSVNTRKGFYRRTASNSSSLWDPWQYFGPVTVASPAGQPGATMAIWDNVGNKDQLLVTTGTPLGTTNLDAVTVGGEYVQSTSSNATLARNYPVAALGGVLEVIVNQFFILQRWTTLAGSGSFTKGIYQRRQNTSTLAWDAWAFVPYQRINSPTSQPGLEVFTWDDVNGRDQLLMPAQINLNTTDLDLVTLPGVYYQQTTGTASVARHYPVANVTGILEVLRVPGTADVLLQRFTPTSGSGGNVSKGQYIRRALSGVWAGWQWMPSLRVDQTAGRAIYTWDDANNREQLIYGDTGWRELSTLLANSWTAGSVLIRRRGSMVHMKMLGLNPAPALNDNFLASATVQGFRNPNGQGWHTYPRPDGSIGYIREQSGNFADVGRLTGGGAVKYASFTWMTDDPWPTVLPGTAVGTIPTN